MTKIANAFCIFAVSLSAMVCVASGQVRSRKQQPKNPSNTPPASDTSRSRRIVANSTAEIPDSSTSETTNKSLDESSVDRPADFKPTPSTVPKTLEDSTNPGDIEVLPQIEAAPDTPERNRLRLKLSEHLAAEGKKSEAAQELFAIVKSDSFDPQGLYNAGNALWRLGDSEDAIAAYHKAINQRNGNYSRALNNLGVVLLAAGRWDEAQEALLSALKLESFRYAEASYNLGRLYSVRGEKDMAIREWRRTLTIDPEHVAAAQSLSHSANTDIAVKAKLSAKVKTFDSNGEHSASAGAYSRTRSARVLVVDPITYGFLQQARDLREQGKLDAAVGKYKQVIARWHGYFPPANLELSYALLTLKKVDEAFANLRQVANRDGTQYPIVYLYLGRVYELKGDLASAEQSFYKANMAYKTRNNSLLLDLSRVRERLGNFMGALAAMEEYARVIEQQGPKPTWLDESLSTLRQKANGSAK